MEEPQTGLRCFCPSRRGIRWLGVYVAPYLSARRRRDAATAWKVGMSTLASELETKSDISHKVLLRFGLPTIQIMWASVPAEGFAMIVGQNGTQWDTEKRCFQLPKGFGTGVPS